MQRLRETTTPLALAVLTALGCGGGKKEPEPAQQTAPQTAEPQAPAPSAQPPAPLPMQPVVATPDAEGVVHISGSDQMRYSATRIEVKAGQKIKIEMKNAGALPKDVMGHNLIVVKPGTDVTAFAAKGMGAKATDYIPPGAPEIITHTKLLGPGESERLEFDLPGPGSYPFLCSFPGHVGLMNGVIVVQ